MNPLPRLLPFSGRSPLRRALTGILAVLLLGPAFAGAFREVGDGVALRVDRIADGPVAIHWVRYERQRTNLFLQPTLGLGTRLGLGPLTRQIAALPPVLGTPVAAINGDFYQIESDPLPGDPRGLLISRGDLLSAPTDRDCFWIGTDGTPHVGQVAADFTMTWPDGTAHPLRLNEAPDGTHAVLFTPAGVTLARRIRGARFPLERADGQPWQPVRAGESVDVRVQEAPGKGDRVILFLPPGLRNRGPGLSPGSEIRLSFATQPSLAGVSTALGGGPALVRGGRVQPTRVLKANARHPRSALGWNDTHFFLVTVDGRQPGHSMGMTLPELASYLAKEGVTDAMNLDGGASTELWLQGRIVNRPSSGEERNTATGLAVVRRPEAGSKGP